MKYLITGLGNIGDKYKNTRHNIGFEILDTLAKVSNISFKDRRYGHIAGYFYKSRKYILLKPSTYVNRSGLAINHWLKKEKLTPENLLVFIDDIALPFGTIRIRPKGGDGGHNGLMNIISVLGTRDFPRVRFGIGSDYAKGQQVDFVLSTWTDEEEKILPEKIQICIEIIRNFGRIGIDQTMNLYNKKL